MDYLPIDEPAVELSFYLHPDFQHRGLGPEAAAATIDWVFDNLGLDSIIACVTASNTGSQRAIAKIGFTYEASYDYHSPISGKDAQFMVHRLNQADW